MRRPYVARLFIILCRAATIKAMLWLSLFKMAKPPAGWFEPIMKSLAPQSTAQLQANVAWVIKFIANAAHSQSRRKITTWIGYFSI